MISVNAVAVVAPVLTFAPGTFAPRLVMDTISRKNNVSIDINIGVNTNTVLNIDFGVDMEMEMEIKNGYRLI